MKAYKPVPTVLSAVITFAVLGVVFVVIGSVVYSYSQEIVEVSARYDREGNCKDTAWDAPQQCTVTLDIDEDLESPVYFYYELHNYYQNHRRYVKSKSQRQLAGEKLSKDDIQLWGPHIENHPAFSNRTNVQFAKVTQRDHINAEIWERGAGYTLASGSSSLSSSLNLTGNPTSPGMLASLYVLLLCLF